MFGFWTPNVWWGIGPAPLFRAYSKPSVAQAFLKQSQKSYFVEFRHSQGICFDHKVLCEGCGGLSPPICETASFLPVIRSGLGAGVGRSARIPAGSRTGISDRAPVVGSPVQTPEPAGMRALLAVQISSVGACLHEAVFPSSRRFAGRHRPTEASSGGDALFFGWVWFLNTTRPGRARRVATSRKTATSISPLQVSGHRNPRLGFPDLI